MSSPGPVKPLPITAHALALRYAGVGELAGDEDHPLVRWWLSRVGFGLFAHDEIPWCSAFVAGIAWELDLPRSTSAAARSWLKVGTPVPLEEAVAGWDVVVLSRGPGPQPGPDRLDAPGHVGFFDRSSTDATGIWLLGGNQGDRVTVARFQASRVLGVRRLR